MYFCPYVPEWTVILGSSEGSDIAGFYKSIQIIAALLLIVGR
jgi:hypothetical protein